MHPAWQAGLAPVHNVQSVLWNAAAKLHCPHCKLCHLVLPCQALRYALLLFDTLLSHMGIASCLKLQHTWNHTYGRY